MTLRTRTAVLLCTLLVALVAAAPASAQFGGGGGGGGSELGAPEPQEVVPEPVDPNDDGWEAWQTLAVTLAGVALIVGIGVLIVGDARRAAPVDDDDRPHRADAAHAAGGEGEDTRHAHKREAKAEARRKQKIARASRKRNRQRR